MYRCLATNIYKDVAGYQLTAIRHEDMELIRQWRNAQIDVLRQSSIISAREQEDYFKCVILPSFNLEKPKQILFSFFFQGDCIGYGGLTHIDWVYSHAELSFLVNPDRAQMLEVYQADFEHFLILLYHVAFQDLKLHRLIAETYAFRNETIDILVRQGFKKEGVLREHVLKHNEWTDSIVLGLLSSEQDEKRAKESSLLITSISKKIPLIDAVKRAARKSGWNSKIHGADISPNCLGQYSVDHFWQCQPLKKTNPLDILAYCQANQIAAIIPTRDEDVEFYARHCGLFHKQGIRIMVSSMETIEKCLDKKQFSDCLIESGFPAIPAFCEIEEGRFESYVVKERRGAGSKLTSINLDYEKAIEHSLKLVEPIFQPFINGKEWSVDLYRSKTGKVMGCVARERNLILYGESHVTTTRHYPELERLCERLANQLNLYGHAVFQLIESEIGQFHIIECNPRFGGASTASLAVGLDSFFWFLVECGGGTLEEYPFARLKGDIRQIRVPTDRIMPW